MSVVVTDEHLKPFLELAEKYAEKFPLDSNVWEPALFLESRGYNSKSGPITLSIEDYNLFQETISRTTKYLNERLLALDQYALADTKVDEPALLVEKMQPDAYTPTKNNASDAGYDLYAYDSIVIHARGSVLIGTKIKVALPSGHYARVASRSGLSVKHNIEVGAGVIDNGYRGEICVKLYNFSDKNYVVSAGDRIAQMILTPYKTMSVKEVADINLLGGTDRQDKGFGSSGK